VIDAESPVAARRLDVITPTPGWDADVYAANSTAETLAGWGPSIGRVSETEDDQHIDLDTAGQSFRYYLLWITKLPEGSKASISEVELLE
jgi:serine/threonine-protein kinase